MIFSNKRTFEDYLKEQHAEDYTGPDDNMADNFETWEEALSLGEIVDYVEKYVAIERIVAHAKGVAEGKGGAFAAK